VIALIFSTRIINRQIHLLATSQYGLDKNQVMVLDIPTDEAVYSQIPNLKNSLTALPVVNKVSLAGYHSTPTSELSADTYVVKQHDEDVVKVLNVLYVDDDYFDALAISFARGRRFKPPDNEGNAVIVNEAMVNDLGWKNPLEQTIDYGISGTLSGQGAHVVGVVKDFSFHGLQRKPVPLQLYPLGEREPEKILIKLEKADMNTIWKIEKVWQANLKGQPFEYRFLDDSFQRQLEKENKLQKLMTYSSSICIVIACLGLIGMINISFVQKMKEVGIRKVLGATNLHLFLLSWKNHSIQLFIASIIALPLGYLIMRQWLEGFPSKINISTADYVIAISVLIGAVLLVMLLQVYKLVKLNPLESIKQE